MPPATVKYLLGSVPGARAAWGRMRRMREWWEYRRDFVQYSKLAIANKQEAPNWKDRYPCPGQKTNSISFDRHYVYHTSWAARILSTTRPEKHIDISSSLYFVGIVSAFVPLEHYDFRKPDLQLDNLYAGSADLLKLPFADDSISSLSCMHVVEHVGLGRYGDPLDPQGDVRAIRELTRVLAPGGRLIFVVPVGKPKTFFNAHRVYSFEQIRQAFSTLALEEFRLISESGTGGLMKASPELVHEENYGCGCFLFRKAPLPR